ncbi:MAG TPA: immunoglobulin domain-containing protein, partial [Candidatus Binatia bacterium]|nr:immunoglobulin domain-containing protein [Candidatus Binatia bacterium]
TNVPWFPQTNITHDGVSAAQSGVVSGSQQSTLQGVVTGPATITYWWKVNCDSFWMSLAFVLNGSVQNGITGNVDWQQATNYIGAGTQILQWNLYPTHDAFAGGTAWVDRVEITPGGTPVNITANPAGSTNNAGDNVTFSVSATGTPPLLYQWRLNGVSLPDATNATLSLNNIQTNNAGIYSVTVTNDFGGAVSSNATLAVNASAPVITLQPVSQSQPVNGSVTFSVAAKGSSLLVYQWQLDGSPITGAVSNTLSLAGLQMTNAGNYTVVVTNDFGSVTSSVAALAVSPMVVVDCWPNYASSHVSAPSGLSNITAIAVGQLHTLALRSNGTVLAWGDNSYGQTNVPADLTNVVAIAAASYESVALRSNGTVVVWGNNSPGELVKVAGLSNVVSIAAGAGDVFVLQSDGAVVGWGNNNNAQTDIPAGLTNVQSIDAGFYNGFAVNADGTVSQWGNGPVWQHNGTNTQLSVAAGMSNVVAVAAGAYSAWSLQSDGVVDGWGWDAWMPIFNSGVVIALAVGGSSSPDSDYLLELNSNGMIYGGSSYPYGYSSIPFIPSGLSNVVAVAAAYGHAALLINDGAPRVVGQTMNKTVYAGSTVGFAPGLVGARPLSYQWQFNGTNLDGATNAFLLLTNVPLSTAGDYRCIAVNSFGMATNLNASLSVLRSSAQFNTSRSALSFTNGGFSLELDQLSGHGNVIIYASTNLVNWFPIFTNPPQLGSFHFLDSS